MNRDRTLRYVMLQERARDGEANIAMRIRTILFFFSASCFEVDA